ncbi:hypothetical protein C8Q75DRAFT_811393 [Abortiporus biennis]|nr:hypothetical protein C8Q75DRAFT_811393 [Abortiporus biennis]
MGLAAYTYAEQLSHLRYGHPMWRPEPLDLESVLIGDVGHIVDGRFQRLFNAVRPETHKVNLRGVPENFHPLIYDKRTLQVCDNFLKPSVLCSEDITFKLPTTNTGKIEFACSSDRGAILSLPSSASSRSTSDYREFLDYFKKNHRRWSHHSKVIWGATIESEDLILVRGWVKTSIFSLAAITHKKNSQRFYPILPIDTYSHIEGMSVTPSSSQIILYRFGPLRKVTPTPRFLEEDDDTSASSSPQAKSSLPATPEPIPKEDEVPAPFKLSASGRPIIILDDPPEQQRPPDGEVIIPQPLLPTIPTLRDQCIFLSYFKLRRRSFLPAKIVANSDPQDPSRHHDKNSELAGVTESESWKPLDALLDYLLKKADASSAIACDDDVFFLCKAYAWPDDYELFLDRIKPPIIVHEDGVATIYREEYLPHNPILVQRSLHGSNKPLVRLYASPFPHHVHRPIPLTQST